MRHTQSTITCITTVISICLVMFLFCTRVQSFSELNDNNMLPLTDNLDNILNGEHVLNERELFSLTPLKVDLHISSDRTKLHGIYSLKVASNVREGYTLPIPTVKKHSPLSPIMFLELNLTHVDPSLSAVAHELQLNVKVVSWIPTFFMLDVNSFVIYIYNQERNVFESPKTDTIDYGSSIFIKHAYQRMVTIGVFAYNQIETFPFDTFVPITYPRTIRYSKGQGLNVSYSFPKAPYSPNADHVCEFSLRELANPNKLLENLKIVIGSYSFFPHDCGGMDLTSSYITVEFQTSSDWFRDIYSKNLVEIDPSTIGCAFLYANTESFPIHQTNKNGIVTCYLDSHYFFEWTDLYIVASKQEKPHPKPTPPLPEPSVMPPEPNPPVPEPSITPPYPLPSIIPLPSSVPEPVPEPSIVNPEHSVVPPMPEPSIVKPEPPIPVHSVIPPKPEPTHMKPEPSIIPIQSLPTPEPSSLVNPKTSDDQKPRIDSNSSGKGSKFTYLFIIVPIIVVSFVFVVCLAIFVIYWIRRSRYRNRYCHNDSVELINGQYASLKF